MAERSRLKINATGSLVEINNNKTQDGKLYSIGRMISNIDEKATELTFFCFNDKINKRINAGDYLGERIKIRGKIQTKVEDNIKGEKESRLIIHALFIEKARSLKDEARFTALGLIRNAQNFDNYTLGTIEAEAIYKEVCYRTQLEAVAVNSHLRKKLIRNRDQRALIKGKIDNILDEKHIGNKKNYRTICIMESLNIVQDSVSR